MVYYLKSIAEKGKSLLTRVFFAVTLLFLTPLFLCGIFGLSRIWFLSLCFGLLVAVCAGVLVFLVLKHGESLTEKRFVILCISMFVLLVAIQLVLARSLAVNPSWDFGGVYISAKEYVTQGRLITHKQYFARFSNNCGLMMLEILYFSILNALHIPLDIFWGILLNLVFLNAAILFGILFCKRIWGIPRAVMALVISFFFLPYMLYTPIFYTDSLSALFVTLPLYLFARSFTARTTFRKGMLWISISLLLAYGYQMKGSVAILLIALLIYVVFRYKLKQILCIFLALLVPFLSFTAYFQWQVRDLGIIQTEVEDIYKFPSEYWIYMGLSYPGGFNNDDFEYMYGLPDYEARKQAGQEGIVRRIQEYGITGLADHLADKAQYTFQDGGYFIFSQLVRQPLKYSRWQELFTTEGRYYDFALSAASAYHYIILLLMLAGLVLRLRQKTFDVPAMLYAAVLGLSLFLMIWETRSRYLFNFTPIFIALAADALYRIGKLVQQKILSHKEEKDENNIY